MNEKVYKLRNLHHIRARQVDTKNIDEIAEWCKGRVVVISNRKRQEVIEVSVGDGGLDLAWPGSWVFKNYDGVFYIRSNEWFINHYEEVNHD